MFGASTRSPIFCHQCMRHNMVICLRQWCRIHLQDHCSTKVDHLCNHLFLERRIHNGNQGALRNQPRMKAKKVRRRDHNLYSMVNILMKTRRLIYSLNEEIKLTIDNQPIAVHILIEDMNDLFFVLSHVIFNYLAKL